MNLLDWLILLSFLALASFGAVAFSVRAFTVVVLVIVLCRIAKGERL